MDPFQFQYLPPPVLIEHELDASGNLLSDIYCRSCNYNLRGMSITGKCPECGRFVKMSLLDNSLDYSDPEWRRKLWLGIHWLLFGIFLDIIRLKEVAPFFSAIGCWMLSLPDSRNKDRDPVWLRWAMRLPLIQAIVIFFIYGERNRYYLTWFYDDSRYYVLGFFISGIGYCCQLIYIGYLADRNRNAELKKYSQFALKILIIGYSIGLLGVGRAFYLEYGGRYSRRLLVMEIVPFGPFRLFDLIFAILGLPYLKTIIWLRKELSDSR